MLPSQPFCSCTAALAWSRTWTLPSRCATAAGTRSYSITAAAGAALATTTCGQSRRMCARLPTTCSKPDTRVSTPIGLPSPATAWAAGLPCWLRPLTSGYGPSWPSRLLPSSASPQPIPRRWTGSSPGSWLSRRLSCAGNRPRLAAGTVRPTLSRRYRRGRCWSCTAVPTNGSRPLRAASCMSGPGQPSRYVEIDGANHAFAWHRAALRDLVTGWLTETGI